MYKLVISGRQHGVKQVRICTSSIAVEGSMTW